MVSVSPLRLAGAVAVLPPLPQQERIQSSRAVHMRSLAELQKAAAMHTHPDVVYGAMIPDPDYSDDDLDNLASSAKLSQLNTTNNINKNINSILISKGNKNSQFPPSCSPPVHAPSPHNILSSSPSSSSSSTPTPPPTSSPPTMVARNNRVNAGNEDQLPAKPGSPLLQHKDKNNRFDENGFVLPKKLVNPSIDSTEKKSLHRELLFNQKVGVSVLNQKTELQKAMEKHKGKQIAKEQEREKQANLTPFQKVLEQQALKLEQKGEEKTDDTKKEPEATHEFQKLQAKLRSKLDPQ